MNSEKQLYEELIKEHPELKESKVDILEVITLMQQMNPDIVADAEYKASLKKRLDTIAMYNPNKSHSLFGFLKYFIPVFSFGFAVFGFVYFSDEFKPETTSDTPDIHMQGDFQQESLNFAPAEMKMLGNMADEDMLVQIPENTEAETQPTSSMKMSRSAIIDNNQEESVNGMDSQSSKMQSDESSDDVLDELMPMMFSMESVMEDTMVEDEKIIDIFQEICGEYNGLIKVLEDGDKTCILEDKNCLESTYQDINCFAID